MPFFKDFWTVKHVLLLPFFVAYKCYKTHSICYQQMIAVYAYVLMIAISGENFLLLSYPRD